jgi:hypothetical protein
LKYEKQQSSLSVQALVIKTVAEDFKLRGRNICSEEGSY